jgi:hypothetical protein
MESEYMVDSHSAGPRPYNVETFDRKTAQNILSARQAPLPAQNGYQTNGKYRFAHVASTMQKA